MVLIRQSGVFGLLVLAGCSQSLFEAPNASNGPDDSDVPPTCIARCIADAAADYDGTPRGANTDWQWRYLDDHRDRTWTEMIGNLAAMTGAMSNGITTCKAHLNEPACKALPDALLVSTTSGASMIDPAIELTTPAKTKMAIQLSVHAYVPSGSEAHKIRLYRNSREDVLFTGTAEPGKHFQQAITLDAVTADRFLVAVEPTGKGATNVGLHVFATAIDTTFPSTCQLYLPFTNANLNSNGAHSDTDDRCRNNTFTFRAYPTGTQEPVELLAFEDAPVMSLDPAMLVQPDRFFSGNTSLDWSHEVTIQFWVKQSSLTKSAWLFSNLDLARCDGIEIMVELGNMGTSNLKVTACADPTPGNVKLGAASTPYPVDDTWRFIRVVRTDQQVLVCVDGKAKESFKVQNERPERPRTMKLPYLAREQKQDQQAQEPGAFFDGKFDDLRVISGALPCD